MKVMRIVGLVLLWLVTVLASLTFAKAGYGKFADAAGWQYWFERWGFAPWFVPVIGVVELGGAILLLVPRLAPYAAAVLIAVMLGAFYTVSTNETDLSQVDPVINMVLAGIVLSARWRRLWPRRSSLPNRWTPAQQGDPGE